MAYTPNKDRVVKGGIAQVSAQELADFRKQYGEKMGLRDLLNADKGLTRKGEKTVYPQVEPKPKALTRDEMKAQGDFDTSRKYVPRDSYTRSGQKSFDTEKETERLEPDMSNYKPMREPKPLTEVRKPGTNVNYESDETEMKRGGKVKASKMGSVKTAKPSMGSASRRGDGIAQRGKTRGKYL